MTSAVQSGVARVLLAAVLFGVAAPAASQLARSTSAFTLAGLLYLGAAIAVAPAVVRTPPTRIALQRAWKPLLVAVIAGGAVGPVLLMAGLARTTAATGSLLLNTELAATAILAAVFFREHLGRRVLAAVALITVSGLLLTWEPGARIDIGAVLVIAACLAWGLDNCVTAVIDHLSPAHVVAVKGIVAGSANLGIGLLFSDTGSGGSSFVSSFVSSFGLSLSEVVAALVIGAAGYGASIVLWVQGAHQLGATRAQVIFATAPFIGAVAAWAVLGDTLTTNQLIAGALAIVGVAVAITPGHLHKHPHQGITHDHAHHHNDDHHDHHDHDEDHKDLGDHNGWHRHQHHHEPVRHAHPHVPDLHHRHDH
jgi:drug/metabolite transporter (DMT)-like permease